MWIHLAKRLVAAVVTLFLVLVAVFFVFQVLGDPARRSLPINATEEQVQAYRVANGFADPIWTRFDRYIDGAVHLRFGTSTVRGQDSLPVVLNALPRSLLLAASAFLLTAIFGLVLGTLAGSRANSWVDRFLQGVGSTAACIPEFWSGLVLIILLAVDIRLFPTGGYGGLRFLALPAMAMAIPPAGRLMYVVRDSVRTVLEEPFILVARSKGLRPWTLLRAHTLRAALVPIVSMGGLELTRMAIGGVVVIESVFAWPGIGQLYVQAMARYDLPLVSATLFCSTAVVLLLNIALDVLYTRLDPRIEVNAR